MAYGLDALLVQRSSEIFIPEARELAARACLPQRPVLRAYEALQKAGILSARVRHRRGYILLKPRAFSRAVAELLSRRVGAAVAFSLPPYLRGKSPAEILAAAAEALEREHLEARAALHSAFLVEEEPVRSARTYSGPAPVSLILPAGCAPALIEALSLVRLDPGPRKGRGERAGELDLPAAHASADVLIFEKRASLHMPDYGYERARATDSSAPEARATGAAPQGLAARDRPQALRPLHPYLNAALLSLYPLRGVEAAERLIDILRAARSRRADEGALREGQLLDAETCASDSDSPSADERTRTKSER
jgi:hypothetical protein